MIKINKRERKKIKDEDDMGNWKKHKQRIPAIGSRNSSENKEING